MSATHTLHPDVHESGLADGCPACREIADRPFHNADADVLRYLVERAVDREQMIYRSDLEAIAVANVLDVLERCGRLAETTPDLLEVYLLKRWHIPARLKGGNHESPRKESGE